MRFSRFILFAALMLPGFMPAQQVVVSDPVSIRNDYGYEIIGQLRDRVLLFRDRYDNYEIQAFDLQLRASWSRELEDLNKRGTKVLSVIPGKNDFSIVFMERQKGKHYLRIHKYDPAAILIDSTTIKVYGERPFLPPEPDLIKSEDRNCIVVYNNAEKEVLEAVCFQIDKMKKVWDKTALFESSLTDRTLVNLSVSNAGELFVVTEYDNRKARIETHRFQVLKISTTDEKTIKIPFPDALTADVKFVFDNKNKCLTGAGLWAEKNKERANGAFFTRLEIGFDTVGLIKKTPFDDQFISVLRNKDVEDDSKGIDDCDVAQIVLRDDGGAAMVVERHYEVQRGSAGTTRMMRDARLIVDYYYDDMFIIGFGPDGTLQWNTVLHKKQYSQDDEAVFSSYYLMKGKNHLQFLFNDEIRYENSCSTYEVSATGTFDRNSLMNTLNQGLRLRFRDGIQTSANECLVPSEYRSKLKLVAIRY